jgi:microcystin-dependent protein
LGLLTAVNGALLSLVEPENWEQVGGTLTPEETASLMAEMFYTYLESDCMIGMIAPYATTNPPPNCLACDGETYDRVDYPALYSVLDAAYIVDEDSFITPDLRDQFLLSAGPTFAANSSGGAVDVSLTAGENGQHVHTAQPHTHSEIIAVAAIASVLPPPDIIPSAVPGVGVTGPATVTINNSGEGTAHENMPPYLALAYCIVAR